MKIALNTINQTDFHVTILILIYNYRFNIDPVSGNITLAKKLDYETNPRYELLLIAVDQGSSPRQKSVPLSLQILDYNDFGPIFNPASYRTSIRETDMSLLIPVTVQVR